MLFHSELDDFLKEFIEEFGENIGLRLNVVGDTILKHKKV